MTIAFGAFAERAVFADGLPDARAALEAPRFDAFAAFLEVFLAVFLDDFDFDFETFPAAVFALARPDAGFLDFLRVFLDICLPFVAFSGSLTVFAAGLLAGARIWLAAGQI